MPLLDKSDDLELGSLDHVMSLDETLNDNSPDPALSRVAHRSIPGRAIDSIIATFRQAFNCPFPHISLSICIFIFCPLFV